MHAATVHALDAELKGLAADERRGLVQFLRRLDLLDREGGFELFKCSSAYEYLVKEHHLPEGTAWRRANAMSLIRRFPTLEAALEDGRLNPTQLGILGRVLTPENVDEVVGAATHRTKRQTEELAAAIVPRKVPAPGLRRLPPPRSAQPALEPQAASPVKGLTADDPAQDSSELQAASPVKGLTADDPAQPAFEPRAASPVKGLTPDVPAQPAVEPRAASPVKGLTPDDPAQPAVEPQAASPVKGLTADDAARAPAAEEPPRAAPIAAPPRAPARITPVARAEWQWRVRIDEARMAKLERLKGLLAHVIPDGDLDRVFDRMLDDSLAVEGKKRGFVEPCRRRAPSAPKAATPGERAPIPRDVRREVLKRDGYRCTWVHPDGSRCGATSRLELDHLEPARETGSSRPEDLTTRCRHHNQLRAIRTYGRAYVRERIGEARRVREARRALRTITGGAARQPAPPDGGQAALGA